jgi:hypothetical protein
VEVLYLLKMRELIRHIIREHIVVIREQSGKKRTTDDFIRKAKEVHGDKYDYSEVDYKGYFTPVKIICPIHGAFMQNSEHLRGAGCNKCGYIRATEKQRRSGDDFINKMKEIYGDKYDFSNAKYTNALTKVSVTCPKHGDFNRIADDLLRGRGCPKCSQENVGMGNRLTQDEFISRSNLLHDNKFDYSKVDYDGIKTPVKIICPLHGEYLQTPSAHLKGYGCKKCGVESTAQSKVGNTEDFIKSAKIVHGDKYDYSQVNYKNSRTPVKIRCLIHGEFTHSPNTHLSGKGCPTCQESTGEKLVATILKKHEVNFIKQHKFVDCTNKKEGISCRKLPFDFYIPELNVCIEYDGEQHFIPKEFFGGEEGFSRRQQLDKIKDQYCMDNGIKLIRIPYTMNKKDIEPYILSELGM